MTVAGVNGFAESEVAAASRLYFTFLCPCFSVCVVMESRIFEVIRV